MIERPDLDQINDLRSSAVARSNTSRLLKRPHTLRARSTPVAESIEVNEGFHTPLQESTTRPSQDSLAGNIRKILIALDIGSGNIKAAWKAVFDRREQRALVHRLRHGCKPVVWNNLQAHCPAQVAFKIITGDDGRSQLQKFWGCDVDDELDRGGLEERDVLKWIKPVIFNYDDAASSKYHKGQLQRRLRRLKFLAEESHVPEAEWADIDEVSLYSDLMGFAYRFVCEKICEEFPRLASVLVFGSKQNLGGIEVEVGLPVPASSLPKHIKMVLEAAKRAGLPRPCPVAEPSAAVVYYLQEQMETTTDQQMTDSQTILLLDAGEGSLDATLCSVVPRIEIDVVREASIASSSPSDMPSRDRFVLKEEVAGLTEWAGGSFANQACQAWLEENFDVEFEEMLCHPVHGQRYSSKANIIDGLIREFERKKKRFSGSSLDYGDEVRLMVPGFPATSINTHHGGYIVVDRQTVEKFFSRQIDASIRLISQQVERLLQSKQGVGRLRWVDQIILVGGANESRYVRGAIQRRLMQNAQPEMSGRVEIRLPQVERLSTLTAQGALLLLQDKDFIGERVLRRGYCVKWAKETSLKRSTRQFRVERDSEDGAMCIRDVSKFLLRRGDRVAYRHKVSMRSGWRALCMEPAADDTGFDIANNCFLIDEHFFFCDKESFDDQWVYHKPNGFHEVGTVTFRLDRDLCHRFVETYEHEGRDYWRIQYEVSVEIVGLDFRYKMVIPETGQFDTGPRGYGRRPIIAEGLLTWEDEGGLCIV